MPAKNPATIALLAQKLQLSKGAVSRILNGDTASFSTDTQMRVRMMANEIGYKPNPIARALATGKTGVISLWLANLKASYFAHVAEAVEKLIDDSSHRMSIRLYDRDFERKEEYSQLIFDTVDGVITHGNPPESWLKPFESGYRFRPLVYTGTYRASSEVYSDMVNIDLGKASSEAVRHLVASGRKRIAMFTPIWDTEVRVDAYKSVMENSGREPELIECISNDRPVNRRIFKDYIEKNGCPDALFCHNDSGAISVYRTACDLGIKVPDDLALIGCDGLLEDEYMTVTLSTIVSPVDEMAKHAWDFLQARLESPDSPRQLITLEAHLVLRESSEA